MTKILGLDLGTNSIGWALVEDTENGKSIIGMGSRIIPLDSNERDEFSKGNAISKNQNRTIKRTQRKLYHRYKLRRGALTKFLLEKEMFPGKELLGLEPLKLWGIRAKAVSEKISLPELGRVLYHLNQKRGYKSSRGEANMDKKDTEYVTEVKNRYQELKEAGLTIGQRFYKELEQDINYRMKSQVYPREAYEEEFDVIIKNQKNYYPEILTDEFVKKLRNEIIYYQRNLKSQKGLVGVCEFEGFWSKRKDGSDVFAGPKVAPRSSPIFQYSKIWESINTISIKNKFGEIYQIPSDKKHEIFEYLDDNERLTATELFKILGIKKGDGWYYNKQLERGIQGNLTKAAIKKVIGNQLNLISFKLHIDELPDNVYLYNRETGEVLKEEIKRLITNDIQKEPLYDLWHTIYSIKEQDECKKALQKKFDLNEHAADALAFIDFSRGGFGNKSAKAMRKIIPYLKEGYVYSDACTLAGYNHSGSLTKDENLKRILVEKIPILSKNSLRQPVVEKILNQMINLVNAIIDEYGKPDEIRIELARELKQSKDERNETFRALNKRERENELIRKRLENEYGIRATRKNVIKWRLFHEISGEDSKLNASCIYCGQPFGISDALKGNSVDVEHIIPKALLFDDSQSNKTLSHRHCNEAKKDQTAFDFMKQKGERELSAYIERVDKIFKDRLIGKAKRDKLLMPKDKIPKDFIQRQLRETQYISRKSKEILEQVCHHVWSTSGSVTEYLRRLWGWNDVLMNLQLPKYRDLGLTEWKEWESGNGRKHKQEVIKDWTKRNDHRHHAVDALVVACTRQGFIQRINNLSSQGIKAQMYADVEAVNMEFRESLSLLDKYLITQRPFTTLQVEEKTSEILVSFKPGKKVATLGRRKIRVKGKPKIVQSGIIVPRGSLSEESVYGCILMLQRDYNTGEVVKHPLKYVFNNPHLIFKPYIKKLVEGRLKIFEGDAKLALKSLKEDPIYLDKEQSVELQYASCYAPEYVIKYPLEGLKVKDLKYIVDKKVRDIIGKRLDEFNGKEKEAFSEPLWFDKEKTKRIRSVRCFTGLASVEAVKLNDEGEPIGFVKPGNNHHIAFYEDETGKVIEHVCTFWHAVERRKNGLPAVIKDPANIWTKILHLKDSLHASFLGKLPADGLKFKESMQQNEMFVLGLEKDVVEQAINNNDKRLLSQYLYRVQKLAASEYVFRHHLETQLNNSKEDALSKKFFRLQSMSALQNLNPVKLRFNYIGLIDM